eukprot:jgi/Botrbrau1/21968/Bobra.0249s0091.1
MDSSEIDKELKKDLWLSREEYMGLWDVSLSFDDGYKLLSCRPHLAYMSEYFRTKFESTPKEGRQTDFKVGGVESYIMEGMVAAYYLEELEVTDDNVNLYAEAAARFSFPHITAACRSYMLRSCSPPNAAKYLSLSEKVPSLALRQDIIDFIAGNLEACLFIPTVGFADSATVPCPATVSKLSLASLTEILASNNLRIPEIVKLLLISTWLDCQDWFKRAGVVCPTMPCQLFETINIAALNQADLQTLVQHPLISSNIDYIRRIVDTASTTKNSIELAIKGKSCSACRCPLSTARPSLKRCDGSIFTDFCRRRKLRCLLLVNTL